MTAAHDAPDGDRAPDRSAPDQMTQHAVKIDLQGLIRLLAKNLYAEDDVFVRELVQNAHDSIKRRGEIEGQAAPPGEIQIRIDAHAGTIAISDNGSGLTEREVHEYLATIGRSGTGELRQELIKRGRQAEVTLIGQFGIGLLSAFVAAHRVEVETLSVLPDHPSWLWTSEGQSHYALGRGQRQQVGTTVTLHIADTYRDMLDVDTVRKAVKKYADFIPYPIYLNDEGASANAVNAPWHRTFPTERERLAEYWAFVDRRFPDYALDVIPIALAEPYRVDGVLYISDRHIPDVNTAGLVDIYQARMLITAGNRDMLPPWAKFLRGVIDSPDLTPTAARDAIQFDTAAREIRDALGRVVVEHLTALARNDPYRLERILEWHAYHIKGMAVAHDDFFDAIADIVPFETNRGTLTLQRYRDLAPHQTESTDQDIFYVSERGSATQFYMLCNARDLLVISAGIIFEESFLKKYAQRRPGVRVHQISVDGSELLFEKLKPAEAEQFRRLELDFQRVMPDAHSRARAVRFKPAELPAVTVLSQDAKLHQELEETRRNLVMPESVRNLADRLLERQPTVPVILHLNADNPTIQKLAQMANGNAGDAEPYRVAVQASYNNAMLLAQHLMTPNDAQAIFTSSNQTIALMIAGAEQLADLRARLDAAEQTLRERERQLDAATMLLEALRAQP